MKHQTRSNVQTPNVRLQQKSKQDLSKIGINNKPLQVRTTTTTRTTTTARTGQKTKHNKKPSEVIKHLIKQETKVPIKQEKINPTASQTAARRNLKSSSSVILNFVTWMNQSYQTIIVKWRKDSSPA